MKIVLTTKRPTEGFLSIREHRIVMTKESKFSRSDLELELSDCDILIPSFDYPIDKSLMDMAPNLKLIANFGVGFNNIDLECAKAKGIQVSNTPDPVIEPTAEQAFTLMLAVAHRTAELDRKMRMENSPIQIGVMNNLGISIYGKTLGIIGMGRIGQSFAKRAHACGMEIWYHNRNRLPQAVEGECHATYVDFDTLIAHSDFISLHMPYNSDSHHLINESVLNQMKESAVLINTARGAVVDEEALVKHLQQGKLWGAGLDVFEHEPIISSELYELDNVVMSPHIGTGTIDGRLAMCVCVCDNIHAYLTHGTVINRVI